MNMLICKVICVRSGINEHIEGMATFTALVKIYPTKTTISAMQQYHLGLAKLLSNEKLFIGTKTGSRIRGYAHMTYGVSCMTVQGLA